MRKKASRRVGADQFPAFRANEMAAQDTTATIGLLCQRPKKRQPMRMGALFEDIHVVLKMHPNITTTGRPRRAKRS